MEKVSIWNEAQGKPRRAIWLTNTSGLTLDSGSFSVIDEEAFAGEGLMEPIRPQDRRLLSYATDLALTVSTNHGADRQPVTRVRNSRGSLIHTSETRERKTYTVRNTDERPRTVIIEHPVRAGWQMRSTTKPEETTSSLMRFRVEVGPKQTVSLPIEEARPEVATYALSSVTPDQIALFVRQKSMNPQIEEALGRVLAQKKVVSDLNAQSQQREREVELIFEEQQRLRENLKALKGRGRKGSDSTIHEATR